MSAKTNKPTAVKTKSPGGDLAAIELRLINNRLDDIETMLGHMAETAHSDLIIQREVIKRLETLKSVPNAVLILRERIEALGKVQLARDQSRVNSKPKYRIGEHRDLYEWVGKKGAMVTLVDGDGVEVTVHHAFVHEA